MQPARVRVTSMIYLGDTFTKPRFPRMMPALHDFPSQAQLIVPYGNMEIPR